MLVLTAVLLPPLGLALGLARRPWWEVGLLTLLACVALQATEAWVGDWRRQVGLPDDQRPFQSQAVAWLLIGVGTYVCYGLAYLHSRRRSAQDERSDR